MMIIREVDAHVQGGLSLVKKPAKSDQWQAFIVPEFIHSKQEHCHTMGMEQRGGRRRGGGGDEEGEKEGERR